MAETPRRKAPASRKKKQPATSDEHIVHHRTKEDLDPVQPLAPPHHRLNRQKDDSVSAVSGVSPEMIRLEDVADHLFVNEATIPTGEEDASFKTDDVEPRAPSFAGDVLASQERDIEHANVVPTTATEAIVKYVNKDEVMAPGPQYVAHMAARAETDEEGGGASDSGHSVESVRAREATKSSGAKVSDTLGERKSKFFDRYKIDEGSTHYQTFMNDAVFNWLLIDPYAWSKGVYANAHLYDGEAADFKAIGWQSDDTSAYPLLGDTLRRLYPATNVITSVCDALSFSAGAKLANLARVPPSYVKFGTTADHQGRTGKGASLVLSGNETAFGYFVTVGIVRRVFLGPDGTTEVGSSSAKRGVTLAPFDGEIYRIACCLRPHIDELSDMVCMPLADHGGVAFTTKPINNNGEKPGEPKPRGRPTGPSSGNSPSKFRKAGVLEYVDTIPVIDGRGRTIDWNSVSLQDLQDTSQFSRMAGEPVPDSLACAVYTVNRWAFRDGREHNISFNVNAIVVLSGDIDKTAHAASFGTPGKIVVGKPRVRVAEEVGDGDGPQEKKLKN
ncbi:hypothetical protein BD626DRAFT_570848 [Schizophyllum amplum]|uniref:Uncharacterized protein n=1 Tax=Schizophyllum amplum TaxID=97359 RepID=A0A550CA23_9AGAR|nr:hypothetical protein BD626DRAFT_570848 [Auriculariopsis ampla]